MADYPRVTHPCAAPTTEYCYPVISARLACLIHAASVRSEPESNSPLKTLVDLLSGGEPDDFTILKLFKRIQPTGKPMQNRLTPGLQTAFRIRCLLKGLLTYRTFQFSMSSVPQSGTKNVFFGYQRLPWVTAAYCWLPEPRPPTVVPAYPELPQH